MTDLAIKGGSKTICHNFKLYNTIGNNEIKSVTKVLKSGVLSPYLGAWNNIPNIGSFYGGKKVNEFENYIKSYFSVKHAITVNSWTSGLITAIGSLDIEPGDEIIVSTWTMCATATAIINWMAVPVFADINKDTFNIDPKSIVKNITNKTRAIVAPDIFGQSTEIDEIKKIAKQKKIKIISDSAQSIASKYKNKFSGTLVDIGGFSLNYHKHIQTGEGGILITNSDRLAQRMRLIRNHGEAVVYDKKVKKINNIIGYNFRMGEIEAAIGIEQLKKLESIVKSNQQKAELLNRGLSNLKGLKTPIVCKYNSHVYYYYAMLVDQKITKVHRDKIYNALIAEGVPLFKNYTLVHLLPMYQRKIAFGNKGYPWVKNVYKGNVSYKKGICPVAENINENQYLGLPMCNYNFTRKDIQLIIKAFKKVWKNIYKL